MDASATVIEQPPGKTKVQLTWEPAESGVMADWYDLDFVSNLLYVQYLDVPGVSESVELMVAIIREWYLHLLCVCVCLCHACVCDSTSSCRI